MAKRVIQVPIDELLLKELDGLSVKQHKARSEVIRQACIRYLQDVEDTELDKVYRDGYLRVPEEPGIGEAQVAMLDEVLPEESW